MTEPWPGQGPRRPDIARPSRSLDSRRAPPPARLPPPAPSARAPSRDRAAPGPSGLASPKPLQPSDIAPLSPPGPDLDLPFRRWSTRRGGGERGAADPDRRDEEPGAASGPGAVAGPGSGST